MTEHYVAVRPLRLGHDIIQPGERVPILPGRSYHQMLSLNQIAKAAAPAESAGAKFRDGTRVYFVNSEGEASEATCRGLVTPDEAVRKELELGPGEQAVEVEFDDDAERFLVPRDQVVRASPAVRLLAERVAQLRADVETSAAREQQQQTEVTTLRQQLAAKGGELDWANLLLSAVTAEGEALPDGEPGVKELLAHGVRTREGARLLVGHLTRLKGIGQPTEEKILGWLNAEP